MNKGQLLITNYQARISEQYPITEISMIETKELANTLFGNLDFGYWDLFGAWDLGIGIWH
jgi:hypothetical protein